MKKAAKAKTLAVKSAYEEYEAGIAKLADVWCSTYAEGDEILFRAPTRGRDVLKVGIVKGVYRRHGRTGLPYLVVKPADAGKVTDKRLVEVHVYEFPILAEEDDG